MLNAKDIRKEIVAGLTERFGNIWFEPGSAKLKVDSAKNLTDFAIEIDLWTERRYGAYACSAVVVHKWIFFSKFYRKFLLRYDPALNNKINRDFLRTSFDNVIGGFKGLTRNTFWVEHEKDIENFLGRCVSDLEGGVGEWIEKWFAWPSALAVMNENPHLCGVWRDVAYYCLLEKVHGAEAAYKWAEGLNSTGLPKLQAAQVEYLRSQVCRYGDKSLD